MISYETLLTTIIVSVFGSTGFWALITQIIQRRDSKVSSRDKVLLGLAHRQICLDGESCIKKGYVTHDEYESLHDYLFVPYKELGGNGSAERIMKEVEKLPLRSNEDG